jgi:hypothetical protein
MIRITMSHATSPLTSALYPAEMEDRVLANLEAQGYTVLMVESTSTL